jgi:predicted nucleic acid-binding protein
MPTIVDTNVISELLREPPDPAVKAWWFGQLVAGDLFTTAITEAELRYGLAIMPAGQRRDGISRRMEYMLREHFAGRILPFDSAAAHAYAIIYADRRLRGRPTSPSDCQIAAIARVLGAIVATRNVPDFLDSGVEVVNPWSAEGFTQ